MRKSCEWVNSEDKEIKKKRCNFFKSHCPATCAEYFTPACATDSRYKFSFFEKTVKKLIKKGCKWVVRRKALCKNPGIAKTCRGTCKPDICEDSPFKYSRRKRSCSWVSKNPQKRCRSKQRKSFCAQTCRNFGGKRYCSRNARPRNIYFEYTYPVFRGCKLVAKKPSKRCKKPGVKETCRATCASF